MYARALSAAPCILYAPSAQAPTLVLPRWLPPRFLPRIALLCLSVFPFNRFSHFRPLVSDRSIFHFVLLAWSAIVWFL
jgi:hypothetical protein